MYLKILLISGAVYQLYQETHKDTKASDVAKALFEQLLSPQGVQNRITLWSREIWSARLFHSIVSALAAPEATIAEYSNKGSLTRFLHNKSRYK